MSAMTEAIDLSLYAKPESAGTLGMDVAVEGISCGACSSRPRSCSSSSSIATASTICASM